MAWTLASQPLAVRDLSCAGWEVPCHVLGNGNNLNRKWHMQPPAAEEHVQPPPPKKQMQPPPPRQPHSTNKRQGQQQPHDQSQPPPPTEARRQGHPPSPTEPGQPPSPTFFPLAMLAVAQTYVSVNATSLPWFSDDFPYTIFIVQQTIPSLASWLLPPLLLLAQCVQPSVVQTIPSNPEKNWPASSLIAFTAAASSLEQTCSFHQVVFCSNLLSSDVRLALLRSLLLGTYWMKTLPSSLIHVHPGQRLQVPYCLQCLESTLESTTFAVSSFCLPTPSTRVFRARTLFFKTHMQHVDVSVTIRAHHTQNAPPTCLVLLRLLHLHRRHHRHLSHLLLPHASKSFRPLVLPHCSLPTQTSSPLQSSSMNSAKPIRCLLHNGSLTGPSKLCGAHRSYLHWSGHAFRHDMS